jgi:hypothetical protein
MVDKEIIDCVFKDYEIALELSLKIYLEVLLLGKVGKASIETQQGSNL